MDVLYDKILLNLVTLAAEIENNERNGLSVDLIPIDSNVFKDIVERLWSYKLLLDNAKQAGFNDWSDIILHFQQIEMRNEERKNSKRK
jgi:hypothetical protein